MRIGTVVRQQLGARAALADLVIRICP